VWFAGAALLLLALDALITRRSGVLPRAEDAAPDDRLPAGREQQAALEGAA
jgi:hypothetical protein